MTLELRIRKAREEADRQIELSQSLEAEYRQMNRWCLWCLRVAAAGYAVGLTIALFHGLP